jgi:hypothetical protein
MQEFRYTGAHEIGHEILKYVNLNNPDYSFKHKGSSDYSETKKIKEGGFDYPKSGEIDLMKYYNNTPHTYDFSRIVAEQNDVLGLIWLTKIKMK